MNNYNTLIDDFTLFLGNNDARQKTIKDYCVVVEEFLQVMKAYKTNLLIKNNKDIENVRKLDISDISNDNFFKSINKQDLEKFNILYMQKTLKNSNSTRRKKLSAIKAFFNYLVDRKIIEYNIIKDIKLPQKENRSPIYMKENEMMKFLNIVDNEGNIRDYTIFALLLNTGMRISELINLDINDMKNDTVRIIGKGSQERFVYLNPKIRNDLDRYMEYRLKWLDKNKIKEGHEEALFLSKVYKRITKEAIESNMRMYVKRAGLSPDLTPHKLRHTFATVAINSGFGIRQVQKLLGHKDISTTQIYTHVDDEKLRRDVTNKIQI